MAKPPLPTTRRANERRTWSRHTEASALRAHDPLLDEATRAFDRLDPALKLTLAREIALTRGPELTLAYRNLVMVASGFRVRRTDAGIEARTAEACVLFVVRTKSHPDRIRDPRQILPARLLAHATVDGVRTLVAVPTDVQHERAYAGATPQSDCSITVADREVGTLTALVDVRSAGRTRRMAISALHVLSSGASPRVDPSDGDEVVQTVSGAKAGDHIGRSTTIGGHLEAGPALSFDVQLFEVSNKGRAAAMLGHGIDPAGLPIVVSHPHLDELLAQMHSIEFMVAANHPKAPPDRSRMFAAYASTVGPAYSINYGSKGSPFLVHHQELLRFAILNDDATLPGDSGSAVYLWHLNETPMLVGMHIGVRDGHSLVIPAWHLLSAMNFDGLRAEDTLTLVA